MAMKREKKESRNCPTCGKFMQKFGYYGIKYKCVDLWFDRNNMSWEHD